MEHTEELLEEILILLQRNYTQVIEIERITKEIADSLSRNDTESVGLLLNMRQTEMEKASETKYKIAAILQALDVREREELKALLNGSERQELQDVQRKKVMEISGKVQKVLNRIVEADRVISRKLAGKDSYYQS